MKREFELYLDHRICGRLLLALVACMTFGAQPAGAVTAATDPHAFVMMHADCYGGLTPGGTDLIPLSLMYYDNYSGASIISALEAAHGADTHGNAWVYSFGAPLQNPLTLDWYEATDEEIGSQCRHGAKITVNYIPAPGEDGFDWIQLWADSTHDYWTVDGGNKDLPYYFIPTDDRTTYTYPPGTAYPGSAFGDRPGDYHFEATQYKSWNVFDLFLTTTTFDPTTDTYDVVLHDDLEWGYVAYCVPEPLTMLGVFLSVGSLSGYVRRRLRESKTPAGVA